MKLSNIIDHAPWRFGGAAVLCAMLAACASTPQSVKEQLDPDTGATVTVIDRPIELLPQRPRVQGDPFGNAYAYIAPFETDRMGERTLFLWIAAPDDPAAKLQPQLLCDGEPVGLQPVEGDLSKLSLSRPPYAAPIPWSAQWYFRLPADALQCLTKAAGISLETHAVQGEPERFLADRKSLASLEAFSRR